MLLKILLGIAGALALGSGVFLLVWKIRTRRFRPNPDKAEQQDQINQDLKAAGFAYDRRQDIFYSRMDCWQREMGYCRLYDEAAPSFHMVMHCEPIPFSYAGKRWLIELWKGQYGLTTGGEIGVYCTAKEDVHSPAFTGVFYEPIRDDERLPMSFVLRRNGRVLFRCSGIHWWLTGFRLGVFSHRDALSMDAKIRFPNRAMCRAFVGGLENAGYRKGEFTVRGTTVRILFDTPHTKQPQRAAQTAVAQQINESSCHLFQTATHRFPDTLDKLEYLKAGMPELYDFCMNSLYARGFYAAFGWLLDILRGEHRPEPQPPKPPCPIVPPCPPGPPCLPEPPCRPDPPCCCLPSCQPRPKECYAVCPGPGTAEGIVLCPVPCSPVCEQPDPPKPCGTCKPPVLEERPKSGVSIRRRRGRRFQGRRRRGV